MRNDDKIGYKETIVTINVAVTTYVEYTLSTTKTKKEVMKDINTIGIGIIDDEENYTIDDYEINEEDCLINESEPAIISIDYGEEFKLSLVKDEDTL